MGFFHKDKNNEKRPCNGDEVNARYSCLLVVFSSSGKIFPLIFSRCSGERSYRQKRENKKDKIMMALLRMEYVLNYPLADS